MDFSWLHELNAALLAAALAAAMILAALIGARRAARDAPAKATPAIEGALLGLLGLLLAFTFSGAASRFDVRSHLMVDTANAIRAVARRADFLPEPTRAEFRQALAQYVEAQAAFYRAEHDASELDAAVSRIGAIESGLWAHVVQASHDPANNLATAQLSGTLDAMFSLSSSRAISSRTHMPGIVVVLLFVIATASAGTSGSIAGSSGNFSLANYVGFAILTSLVVYVTLDLDRPGRGIIRRDVQEQAIEAVGRTLGEAT